MSTEPDPLAPATAEEVLSTRVFAHSPAAMWAAFADPARLARWWGPAGFRNSFDEFDLRVGGAWRFTMHGPDGKDYPNHNTFRAVAPGRELSFQHESAPRFVMTMLLRPEAGGTRLIWRQRFETAGLKEALAAIVVPSNEQNFDRLAAELAGH